MSTTGGLAVPAADRRAASVLDLTKNCLSKFDVALASQDQASKEALETRLADFNLWVSGVGAIAKTGLSLDSRLQLRPDDVAIVKSVLLMLSDSLEYYVSLSQAGKISHDSVRNIDSAIRNLALIGAAIRRTGKASRSRRADRTFNPDEHRELRKHLECVLLLRPTEEGRRQDELDPSRLSGLQRRLIDANLRRRHQFLLAQRRSRNEGVTQRGHPVLEVTPPVDETPEGTKDTRPDNSRNPKGSRDHPSTAKGIEPLEAPTISGFSRASTAEGSMKYAPAKPYIPGTTKTQITSIASDVEFPHPPAIPDDREIFLCPCCCQSLPVATFKDSKLWKRHLVEDLCPYTCIAENCPTPHLLFCTRSEWEAHVKKSHVPRWQCPFCAGDDAEQPSMEAMADHLQTRHNDKLSSKSLSTLLSWSAVQTMGIKTCPFCSDYGPEDAPDLVDHVLQEAYDFALRALPWPKPVDHELNEPPGLFKLPDKVDDEGPLSRWISEPIHVPGGGDHSELKLCPWDTADHSEPLNLDEYTDYFDEGGYFRDKHEGRSLAAQSRSSEAEPGDTVDWKALEDEPGDTVDRETLDAEPGGTVHRETLEARLDVLYDGLGNSKHVVDAEIDIVAVPGFNFGDELNHAEETWTKDNKLWLRDVLPLSLPTAARVMLFAYDSCPSIGATAVDIVDHGRNLLQRLRHERVDAPERPIAFICHSLGGLVVKQALFEASASYDPVFEATCFLVFFGTPHQRGSYETVGHVAARIFATAITPSLETGADGLQEALKQNVNDTTTVFDRIGHLLFQRCAVINFFETRMTRSIGIVVDRNSATLGLSGAVETQIHMDADHSSLCKFESDSYNCKIVCRDIAAAVRLGLEHRGRRPLDQQTDAPATDSAAEQTEANPSPPPARQERSERTVSFNEMKRAELDFPLLDPLGSQKAGTQRKQTSGITNPVAARFYVYVTGGKQRYPVLILPWDDASPAGLVGTLADTGIFSEFTDDGKPTGIPEPPKCYVYDEHARGGIFRIRDWAKGYENGGPLEREREFPVLIIDNTDRRMWTVGWVKAARLCALDFDDPSSRNIPFVEEARDYFYNQVLRQRGSNDDLNQEPENHKTPATEAPRDNPVKGPEPEAEPEAALEPVLEPQMEEEDDFWGPSITKKVKKKKKTRAKVGLDFEPQLEPEHEPELEPVRDIVPNIEEENDTWGSFGTKRGKETKNEKRQPGLEPDEPEEHAPEESGEALPVRQSSPDQPIVTDSTSADTERRLPQRPNSRDDFEIAVICALSIEANAVDEYFDHYWDDDKRPGYGKAPGDPNTYSVGVVGRHNVVLALMSGIGKANAAVSAASCRMSFPNIKLALIVGICGAVPFYSSSGEEWTEIVLGDVVVSDNLVQYDLGRPYPTLRFETVPTRPNAEIRSMLAKIRTRIGRKRLQEKMASSLAVFQRGGERGSTYPGTEQDRLFDASYIHVKIGVSCEDGGCDGELLSRARLTEGRVQPAVHFGAVASGDTVMRSGKHRDDIAGKADVIGFEMEAAGVWDSFPCVLIKGVCDYADSHRREGWQTYAAATAAACMKAFLDEWVTDSSSS